MSRTIMLIRTGLDPNTRTYAEFNSVDECLEGIRKIFEEHLRRQNPNTPVVTYDVREICAFIDRFEDIMCFVYRRGTNSYVPRDKEWIKRKIYALLLRLAD